MPSIPREVFAGSCAGIRRDIEPVIVVMHNDGIRILGELLIVG
jgi:hypothetical protein